MGSEFTVGRTYTVHGGGAHFNGKCVKRTKATVTFEVSEKIECWLTGKLEPQGGMTITLRKSRQNFVDEHVVGTPKVWRNVRLEAWA